MHLGRAVAWPWGTTNGEHLAAGRAVARQRHGDDPPAGPGLRKDNVASSLGGVSCTSASACTAAGYEQCRAWPETWNGTAWSPEPIPTPPGNASGALAAVSCASATTCMAVGDYRGSSRILCALHRGVERHLVVAAEDPGRPGPAHRRELGGHPDRRVLHRGQRLHRRGLLLQQPWAAFSTLAEVGTAPPGRSSPRRTSRVHRRRPARGVVHLAQRLHRRGLLPRHDCSSAGPPSPRRGTARPGRSSRHPTRTPGRPRPRRVCRAPRPAACTAVGSRGLADPGRGVERQSLVQPAGTPHPSMATTLLFGVSCTSASACTAVGAGYDGFLAESWNGTSWSIQQAPSPQRLPLGAGRQRVVHLGQCLHRGGASFYRTVTEGLERHLLVPGEPACPGGVHRTLRGVSCVPAGGCTAVGDYTAPRASSPWPTPSRSPATRGRQERPGPGICNEF